MDLNKLCRIEDSVESDKLESEGYSIVKESPTKYQIDKDGMSSGYVLQKKASKWTCNCKGFEHRGKCKHISLVDFLAPVRHPREEIDKMVPEIKKIFKDFDKWEIVGSYRRGVKDFKDIDILVECSPSEFREIETILQGDPNYERIISGPDILRGKYQGYEFDVSRTIPGEWGSFLLYRTGSAAFNIKMRGKLKAKGWALNEHGLFDNKGKLLACETESDIFEAMGMDYVYPKDRN